MLALHKGRERRAGRSLPYSGSLEVLVKRLGRKAVLHGHSGCVNTCNYNASGSLMLSGSDDQHVGVWNTDTFTQRAKVETNHYRNILAAKFCPWDESHVVTGAFDGDVRLTCIDNGSQVRQLLCRYTPSDAHLYRQIVIFISSVEFSPAYNHTAFTSHGGGRVMLHDVREATSRPVVQLEQNAMGFACCPTQPHIFAAGDSSPHVKLFDLRYVMKPTLTPAKASEPFLTFSTRALRKNPRLEGVSGLAWHPSGTEIAANYNGDDVVLYDTTGKGGEVFHTRLQSAQDTGPFVYDTDAVVAERVQLRERMGVSAPEAGTTRVDPLGGDAGMYVAHNEQRRAARNLRGRRNVGTMCKNVCYFLDGRFVATGGDDGRAYFWNRKTAELIRKPKADCCVVNVVCPHPTADQMCISGISQSVGVWEPILPEEYTKERDLVTPLETMEEDREITLAFGGGDDTDDDDDDDSDDDDDDDDDDDEQEEDDEEEAHEVALRTLMLADAAHPDSTDSDSDTSTTSSAFPEARRADVAAAARFVDPHAAGSDDEDEDEEEEDDDDDDGSARERPAATSSSPSSAEAKRRRVATASDDGLARSGELQSVVLAAQQRMLRKWYLHLIRVGYIPSIISSATLSADSDILHLLLVTLLGSLTVARLDDTTAGSSSSSGGGDEAAASPETPAEARSRVVRTNTMVLYRAHLFLLGGSNRNCLEDCELYTGAMPDRPNLRASLLRYATHTHPLPPSTKKQYEPPQRPGTVRRRQHRRGHPRT